MGRGGLGPIGEDIELYFADGIEAEEVANGGEGGGFEPGSYDAYGGGDVYGGYGGGSYGGGGYGGGYSGGGATSASKASGGMAESQGSKAVSFSVSTVPKIEEFNAEEFARRAYADSDFMAVGKAATRICVRCYEEFAPSENDNDACVFHEGILAPDTNPETGPGSLLWDCCGVEEDQPGCAKGRHTWVVRGPGQDFDTKFDLLLDEDENTRLSALSELMVVATEQKGFLVSDMGESYRQAIAATLLYEQSVQLRLEAMNWLRSLELSDKEILQLLVTGTHSTGKGDKGRAAMRALDALKLIPKTVDTLMLTSTGVPQTATMGAYILLNDFAVKNDSKFAKLLTHEDFLVRALAAEVMGKIGPRMQKHGSALVAMLKDKHSHVQKVASYAVLHIGGSVEAELMKLADSTDTEIVWLAVDTLRMLDEAEGAKLVDKQRMMQNINPAIRSSYAKEFTQLAVREQNHNRLYVRLRDYPDHNVRWVADDSTHQLRERMPDQAELVATLLIDDDKQVLLDTLGCLAAFENFARPHVTEISRKLTDTDWRVRKAALDTMRRFTKDLVKLVDRITPLVADKNREVRVAAVGLLKSVAEHTDKFGDDMVMLIEANSSVDVTVAAIDVIAAMGEKADRYSPVVGQMLSSVQPSIRHSAAKCLGQLGDRAQLWSQTLAEMTQDTDPYVRWAAAESLDKMIERVHEERPDIAATILEHRNWYRTLPADSAPGSAMSSLAPSRQITTEG